MTSSLVPVLPVALPVALLVATLLVSALLAICVACAGCLAASIDPALCGTWKTVVKRPEGAAFLEWTIQPDGNYTATVKTNGSERTESGTMTTDGYRFVKTSSQGVVTGTYKTLSSRTFSTTGELGLTEWTRVQGTASSQPNLFPSVYGQTGSGQKYGHAGFGQSREGGGVVSKFGQYPMAGGSQSTSTADASSPPSGTAKSGSGQQEYKPASNDSPQTAELKKLLFTNFPLPARGDEVEQFGLPALGKAADGGMRKRDFRLIQ